LGPDGKQKGHEHPIKEWGNGQNCLHGDAVWLHAKQGRLFLMNKAPSCQNLVAGKVGAG